MYYLRCLDSEIWSILPGLDFNNVINRLGVDMGQQKRYEVFDRIYEEAMLEKQVERNRNNR